MTLKEFVQYLNFNPIIGLILTSHEKIVYDRLILFQSHYRSDFNFI